MKYYRDIIIDTVTKYLPKSEAEWELVGFISKGNEIYTFGNDSKIIGRLFEVMVYDALKKTAEELGYTLKESLTQTVYPDYYFTRPDHKKIAIDIKTTYRRSNGGKYSFTGGSFTSFMRNGTKNIVGHYDDYAAHYILGVVYTREQEPTTGIIKLQDCQSIVPAYKDVEVFIQEKFRICGYKKGSGNTDNIGTISANSIRPFKAGAGPFSYLGEDVFNHYWQNHPRYTDSQAKKDSLFTDLDQYILWLSKSNKEKAEEIRKKYAMYKRDFSAQEKENSR